MLAVSEIPAKHARTTLPPDVVAGAPGWGDPDGDRRHAPGIALACFARLAGRESCSSRHVVPACGAKRSIAALIRTCGLNEAEKLGAYTSLQIHARA
jgi:hypothetical protein